MKTDPTRARAAVDVPQRSREILELQLRKARLQAESARFEAVATELEIQLREWESTFSRATADAEPLAIGDPSGWAPYEQAARSNLAAARLGAGVSSSVAAEPHSVADAVPDETGPGLGADEPAADEPGDFPFDDRDGGVDSQVQGAFPGLDPEPVLDRPPSEISVSSPEEQSETKRRGWPGWCTSAVAHAVVVCALMLISLRTTPPQDAIALSASPAVAAEPLEALEFESVEAPEAEAEPAAAAAVETALGELKAPVDVVELMSGSSSDSAQLLRSVAADFSDAGAMLARSSSADGAATLFCGIEEGGNNICYIVDRSQSMRNGRFEAARAELLRSVDALPPNKRFYVIFYATTLEQMRLGSSGTPERFAVPATERNKAALRRWAMTVSLERGAPPDDALEVALELAPDVIFLLTDGEFPERIEALLDQKNRRESLFGDEGPRSIIHTIGFYSRDGEMRLKRIAEKNGGRYTHIAEP